MLKAFLSHSSKDKFYVEKVAENLSNSWCEYDSFSFESASETAEEIAKRIDSSAIFVFFISKNSLNSEWVKKELENVHKLIELGNSKKILPIIIDQNITHDDVLIPKWLRDIYNIQPIRKYNTAIRRIRQELLRLSWKIDSNKKDKDTLFVGRNDLVDELEGKYRENLYPPVAIIASGVTGIGRRSLLKEYMQKVRITDKSKYIPTITLEINESIEDLILKLDDFGFTSQEISISNLTKQSIEEKISLLLLILEELQSENEIVHIEDNGCLVLPNGDLNDWFKSLIIRENQEKNLKQMILSIVSKYKLVRKHLINLNNIYSINVQELQSKEIDWLFKDLIRINKIDLSESEYNLIKNLFYGHPEQILYAIELLKLEGYQYIYKDTNILIDFNLQKMSIVLSKYKDNSKAKSLLAMLAKFDFVDYELLNKFIGDDTEYTKLMEQFISESICNEIGANRDVIKLNKAIRDTIRRSDWYPTKELDIKVKSHISNFLDTYKNEDKSLSDYFYSMKEILLTTPEKIDVKDVIPSHLLKTIATLYDVEKKWKSVISLAENTLYENFNNLDIQIENQIRFYLCLAYIRNKNNDKFLNEVKLVQGSEHNFLFGFYFRRNGRYAEAIERLIQTLSVNPKASRAKRELVQAYLSTHDYDTALDLARDNYNSAKQSPYIFQAYSTCLIKTSNKYDNIKELETLYESFKKHAEDTDRTNEMYLIEIAKYNANSNKNSALNEIIDVVHMYPKSIYPKIARFDIAERLSNLEEMEISFNDLIKHEDLLPSKSILNVDEALLLAAKGRFDLAKMKIEQLKNYPEKSKNFIQERIQNKYNKGNLQ